MRKCKKFENANKRYPKPPHIIFFTIIDNKSLPESFRTTILTPFRQNFDKISNGHFDHMDFHIDNKNQKFQTQWRDLSGEKAKIKYPIDRIYKNV